MNRSVKHVFLRFFARIVYLPKAALWYDYWTNNAYSGGQSVVCEAPLDSFTLFVRAGSIIPLSGTLTFADEREGEVSEIHVYCGADGEFTLYNDEGDGYAFEQGHFSSIPLKYVKLTGEIRYDEQCYEERRYNE